MDFVYLIIGFIILIVGADKLVDGASSLANNLKVPPIVIGLTVVAFGTSSPEMAVNAFSSAHGKSALVLGNVLGSNIFNMCMIVGVCSLIRPLQVKNNTTWLEVPFNALAAMVVAVMGMDCLLSETDRDLISRGEGITLIGFFLIFLVYSVQLAISSKEDESAEIKNISNAKSLIFIVLGVIGLVLGGNVIVLGASNIAKMFGIPDRVIGLTIVSIGTSLPELAASIAAVRKNNVDIAVGNVVGSNIFNIFLILGTSAIIGPITVSPSAFKDFILNVFLAFILFIFIFTGKGRRVETWEGVLLLMVYVSYNTYLVLSI